MTTGIMDEIDVANVPTPDQLPRPVDLRHLPPHVQRSGAVEALSTQNQDLMARLGVALKRSALLEDHIAELENLAQALKHKLTLAEDEVLVLKEKDRQFLAKANQHENITNGLRSQLQLLETQYAELFATHQQRLRAVREQNERVVSRLNRYLRYRSRMKEITKRLQERVKYLTTNWRREEQEAKELKKHLGDAVERIQTMAKESDQNQRRLVENYEQTLKTSRDQLAELERQNRAYAEKTRDYDELFEKSVSLENQLVMEQRRFNEYRQTNEQETAALQGEVSSLNSQLKSRLIELESQRRDLELTGSELAEVKRESARTVDQIETLRLLWEDCQSQIEKLTGKNQSLQRLNQQLSTTIQGQRQEVQTLRGQLEAQDLATTERIKEIKGQLQMMAPGSLNFVEAKESSESGRILTRIDHLMAEIQSGFKMKSSAAQGEPSATSSVTSSSTTESRGSAATETP